MTLVLPELLAIHDDLENINVFPNPAQDGYVILDLSFEPNDVELLNMSGYKLIKDIMSGPTELDISGFNNGMYLLVIRRGNATLSTKRIVINNF